MIKLKKVTKFYAPQIYNTWAKTGYLYEFENNISWFLCEYSMYNSPALISKKFDLENQFDKIVFGGYQTFEVKDDDQKPDFKIFCDTLISKGLIKKDSDLYSFYLEIFKENEQSIGIDKLLDKDLFSFSYLGLENFRNITEYQEFFIKPLTFVTGKNNSGKSSILKSILLLREMKYDYESDRFFINNSSILNIDVNTIINRIYGNNKFSISLNLDHKLRYFPNEILKADFKFQIITSENIIELIEFKVDFVNPHEDFDFILKLTSEEKEGSVKKISIEKSIFEQNDVSNAIDFEFSEKGMGFNLLFEYENKHLPLINFLSTKTNEKKFIIGENEDNDLEDFLNSITSFSPDKLNSKINYIPSLRSQNKREFDEDSFTGKALSKLHIDSEESEKLNKWLVEFGFGTDKKVLLKDGIYSAFFDGINLADCGFGYLQILTVLTESFFAFKNGQKIVFIEEPESNLHPDLQSKLADFFFDIYKIHGTQFIIETHSEYLIRKSQVIVKKNEDSYNDFIIHFIDKNDNYPIYYESDGFLTDTFKSNFFAETISNIKSLRE